MAGRRARAARRMPYVGSSADVRHRASRARGAIDTVTGPIAADRLGTTLMHEHVLVDFIGAGRGEPVPLRRGRRLQGGAAAPAAGQDAGMRDAGRVHAGLPGPRSEAAEAALRSVGRPHPVEHRLLRRREGQAPARARVRRDRGAAGGALGARVRARHRRHGDQAGVHEDRRRREPAVAGRCQAGARRRARASRDRPADRLAHHDRRGGPRRARSARGRRGAAVRVHLGARPRRARRDLSRRAPRGAAPGWSSTASARRPSRGTSRSSGA